MTEMIQATKEKFRNDLSARDNYDALASEYEEQDEFWDNPYHAEVWRLEHDLVRPFLTADKPLLDLGCGFYPHV
jgi:hypothetical protein